MKNLKFNNEKQIILLKNQYLKGRQVEQEVRMKNLKFNNEKFNSWTQYQEWLNALENELRKVKYEIKGELTDRLGIDRYLTEGEVEYYKAQTAIREIQKYKYMQYKDYLAEQILDCKGKIWADVFKKCKMNNLQLEKVYNMILNDDISLLDFYMEVVSDE